MADRVFNKNGIYFENCDCMERLKNLPDEHFDLLIADLPYGDGQVGGMDCDSTVETVGTSTYNRFGGIFNKYKRPQNEWGGVSR